MTKKRWNYEILNIFIGFTFLFVICSHICLTIKDIVMAIPLKEEIAIIEKEIIEEKEEIVYIPPEVPLIRRTNYYCLSPHEKHLLQQLGMAEAQGEGVIGQALVMRVVINRALRSGKSIEEIIFAQGQFYTVGIGHYIPNKDNEEAIELITNGWDESGGALYFCADGYNGKEPLFKYGGHYFSK